MVTARVQSNHKREYTAHNIFGWQTPKGFSIELQTNLQFMNGMGVN